MTPPRRPESADPRDIADYVEEVNNMRDASLKAHIDSRFDSLRELFLKGFPNDSPELHREYHMEQIQLAQDRRRLIHALTEKTLSGGLWAFIVACSFALWLWVKSEIFKQGPAP